MATAGATAGITQGLEIGKLSAGMGMADRAKIVTQQSAINIGVRVAMAGATGEKLTGIVRGEALSSGLANQRSAILEQIKASKPAVLPKQPCMQPPAQYTAPPLVPQP